MTEEFQQLLKKIAVILERLKIPYAVTGGFAVSIWGKPRSTIDVDVLVQLFENKTGKLHSELVKIFELNYLDKQTMIDEVAKGGEFNFIHGDSGIKFDFFVAGKNNIHELELKRRVPVEIDGQKVYFLSAEDLILSKIRWYKDSHSDKQMEDIESVIARQKELDFDYLRKQSRVQGTYEFLEPLLK